MINTYEILSALTKMPYWLAKPLSELDKLRLATVTFWQRLSNLLTWPAEQIDPMTAELELVHLLAWERNIKQIIGETEILYRTRVKYALRFAKSAGSIEGWHNMFETLGMPWVTIEERLAYTEWDVISLKVTDIDLAERLGLIENITREYGRTTRRYQYTTIANLGLVMSPHEFALESSNTIATT